MSIRPDTIDFYLVNVKDLLQVQYQPRLSGTRGIWTNIDIYYTTVSAPNTFIGAKEDLALADDNTLKTIDLVSNAISYPKVVRIIVKAGRNNSSSCAEMKFFSSEATQTTTLADCGFNTSEFNSIVADINTCPHQQR